MPNLAELANLSERYVLKISKGRANPSNKTLMKIHRAIKILEIKSAEQKSTLDKIRDKMKEKNISIRALAAALDMDASNMAKILTDRRSNENILIRAHAYLTDLKKTEAGFPASV
jgi:transcriptional regulator with XRE-family HTH domain